MTDEQKAILGDQEAAKRLTDAGVRLMQGDCLELLKDIPDGSVDMVLCDLPYGVTDMEWDVAIPTKRLFEEYRRVCKQNANVVLFCLQPFATELITNAYKTEFSHTLIWAKNTKTRAKSSKTVPMAQYEEIAVFRINKVSNKGRHKELREYFITELYLSGFTVKQIEEKINNRSAHHFFRLSSDFRIPTAEAYKRLQDATGRFQKPYEEIRQQFDAERKNLCTYNPPQNNTNLLFFDVPSGKERVHPTQKPVSLLEHLIRAYTNDGETVLDNCMGSGSTGVACINTCRKFIGMELDTGYFEIAKQRIEEAQEQARLAWNTRAAVEMEGKEAHQ